MEWSYSGNPASSLLDQYRFYIGDTDEHDQLLTDGEINFVLDEYPSHNYRLYKLFDGICNVLSKRIKRSLGPQSEDPTSRLRYYERQHRKYEQMVSSASFAELASEGYSKPIFDKGMHDNV